jgi:exopolysaccharide biosynthesis protein
MSLFRKRFVWAASYALALTIFTVYVALDTFVIPRTYAVLPQSTAQAESASDAASARVPVVTETTYADGSVTITLTEYQAYDTTIYVADITLARADALKTAFAGNAYGRNIKESTSDIADESCAILAVNGDFYGARTSGYVIRNGVLYRATAASASQEDLVIYEDGSFEIVREGDVTAEELLAAGAAQVLSFGPGLVEGGTVAVTADEEVGQAMASNPRTAIGIIDELHYVMVVADGRTSESAGLSLYELATFMQGLGVTTAYNLDGGGSSTMYFCGEVVNNPTTNGKSIQERSVSDIVYIG